MPAARITVVGSLNVDLVVQAPRAPGPGETVAGTAFARHAGGKGANQAAAAARLFAGTVALIGRVGADAEGAYLLTTLQQLGVDTAGVGQDPETTTGIAAITVSGEGENRIVLVPGANQTLTPGILGLHHDVLAASDLLLLQLEIPLPTVQTAARMGREKHATIILDPAPARPLPPPLLRLVDYLTPNESELGTLLRRPPPDTLEEVTAGAQQLLAMGARNVVVKLGARGALLVTPTEVAHLAPFPVDAVDTTAAGDTFNAAFAVALAEGLPAPAAGRFACAAAALSVTRPGAIASQPTRAEVDALAPG
jgi:ribokinase